MKKNHSISTVKKRAREQLLGNLSVCVKASIITLFVFLTLVMIVVPAVHTGFFGVALYELSMTLVQLFMGLFISGSAFLYLNLIYGKEVTVKNLFAGFTTQPDKAIKLQLILLAIDLVCASPLLLLDFTGYANRLSDFSFYLLMLACELLSLLCKLGLSQVFFLLHDFPERSVKEIVQASFRLMKGQKIRLLVLMCSFLPLALVCALTFFVPFLWLAPYYRAAMAAFYQDVIEKNAD
ncbi:MAG: DUF975 family protein [Lachnospiraceae bacterium]|jgi:hypothetical protein|nr:DUF975 family protein [Lachnospiraceae bacterium]